ncbi:MAG: ferritin-like domain-containing protein [Taibaiella sp.]|nr:ferritin-like domain-containing protein [Taibaiella sp.]
MKPQIEKESRPDEGISIMHDTSRRRFLQLAGGIAGAGIFVASCRRTPPDTVYVGKGDIAVLNNLYIMEQVLAAFYSQANITPYYGLTASELELIDDLRDHQLAHKGILKATLGTNAITDIVTVLTPVTFADRVDVLNHAIVFEDLAVAAYNGAAKYFTDTNYILLTAKMATVQARHSAYAREILSHNTFSDSSVVDVNGLDRALSPLAVFTALKPYIETKFDISNLPG